MFADAPTLITVAVSALTLAGSALGIAKMALDRKGSDSKAEVDSPTVGKMTIESLENTLVEVVTRNSNQNIMPLLIELKQIAQSQVAIQQKQNEILVELVTVSRIGQRK